MSNTGESDWIITLDASHPIDSVVSELTKIGLVVGQVLASVGVVVARGSSRQANLAREIRGVSDVSIDQPIDIGPPGGEPS